MNARARWVKYQAGGLGRDAAKLVSLRRASKGIGKIGRKGDSGLTGTGYLDKRRKICFSLVEGLIGLFYLK